MRASTEPVVRPSSRGTRSFPSRSRKRTTGGGLPVAPQHGAVVAPVDVVEDGHRNEQGGTVHDQGLAQGLPTEDQARASARDFIEEEEDGLAFLPGAAAIKRKRNRQKGASEIGLRVGQVRNKYKVGKHFDLVITKDDFTFSRIGPQIVEEAALDGIYVVKTDVPREVLSASETVHAYKSLSVVERAFRTLKMIDLKIRPIHHRLADRVRAHVFLCMLAYYVE